MPRKVKGCRLDFSKPETEFKVDELDKVILHTISGGNKGDSFEVALVEYDCPKYCPK
jgi:hypothetical protein